MEYQDYYKILGVSKTASEKEIKGAYRKLAREFHPDINKSKDAEAKFKSVNEAYEVLSNPENRKKYDEFGARWPEYEAWQRAHPGEEFPGFGPPPGSQYQYQNMRAEDLSDLFGNESPYSDFFGNLFGGGGGFRGGRGAAGGFTPRPRRGQDLSVVLPVSLEDVLNGAYRPVEIPAPTGVKRIEVRIPPGIESGQTIRLAGQGEPGLNGGPPGDLYAEVEVTPNPRFERQGANLETRANMPLDVALVGGEIAVPTLTGRVMLTIPSETPDGKVFRLRGQGMPIEGNPKRRGQMFAEVHVELPRNLTARQKELVRELMGGDTDQQQAAS